MCRALRDRYVARAVQQPVHRRIGNSDEAQPLAHPALKTSCIENAAKQTKEIQMNTSKNRFLLTTAVLLAGVSLASAQGIREGGGSGMSAGGGAGAGAAEHGRSGGAMPQGAGGASHSEGITQGRSGTAAE